MKEIVSIVMLGITLSMDTFSLSLALGILNDQKKVKFVPIVVGLFHFLMPLLGNLLGLQLVSWFNLTNKFLLGGILIFLAFDLGIHYFKGENIHFNLNFIGLLLFALSVSLDSFMVGIGLSSITNKFFVASLIFAMCSFIFTYLGILIGKNTSRYIGKYAYFIGIIILLILGIYHLLN